jgi:hypothetical protein
MAEWLLVAWPQGAQESVTSWWAHIDAQLPGLRRLGRSAQSRWRIAWDDQALQEARGLDHAEGRHGLDWYPHVWVVSVASAVLRATQACGKKNGGCDLTAAEEAARSLSRLSHTVRRCIL